MNLKHIAEGWAKHIGLMEITPEIRDLAEKRVAICVSCEFAREQWMNKFVDDVLQKDLAGSGIGCGKCGCPVNQKALVKDEKCPVNKW